MAKPEQSRNSDGVCRRFGPIVNGFGLGYQLPVTGGREIEAPIPGVPEQVDHLSGEGMGRVKQAQVEGQFVKVQQGGHGEGIVVQKALLTGNALPIRTLQLAGLNRLRRDSAAIFRGGFIPGDLR